jgi:hypothetical protein
MLDGGELHREHRFSDGRVGGRSRDHRVAEGADASRRARYRVRQSEGPRQLRRGRGDPGAVKAWGLTLCAKHRSGIPTR